METMEHYIMRYKTNNVEHSRYMILYQIQGSVFSLINQSSSDPRKMVQIVYIMGSEKPNVHPFLSHNAVFRGSATPTVHTIPKVLPTSIFDKFPKCLTHLPQSSKCHSYQWVLYTARQTAASTVVLVALPHWMVGYILTVVVQVLDRIYLWLHYVVCECLHTSPSLK